MNNDLGNKLKNIRIRHGYTKEDVAREIGVDVDKVNNWEKGIEMPTPEESDKIADLYNMSEEDIRHFNEGVQYREVKEKDVAVRSVKKIDVLVSFMVTFGVLIAYLLCGFIGGLWHKAWVLFLLAAFVPSMFEAYHEKDVSRFQYGMFIVFLYLLLCVWVFNFDLWHPLWVLFLTIPIYHTLVGLFKK